MPMFGYVKGQGLKPLESVRQVDDVDLSVSKANTGTGKRAKCTVCDRLFMKRTPMGMMHFRGRHPELNVTKKAWEQYIVAA